MLPCYRKAWDEMPKTIWHRMLTMHGHSFREAITTFSTYTDVGAILREPSST